MVNWSQIDYILCSQRWREALYSQQKQHWELTVVSDHKLLIAKFRVKLKKVGKTTRLFRYELNQIPYIYTVEVTNRFEGLDPIDRVPGKLWTEVRDIVQEAVIMTIPEKRKCRRQMVVWGGLIVAKKEAEKRREKLRKKEKLKAREKRKHISIWMQSSTE